MTHPALLIGGIAAALLILAPLSALLLQQIAREERMTARLIAISRENTERPRSGGTTRRGGPGAAVAALGAMIARSGLLSSATTEQLQARLAASGVRGPSALGMFVGAKLLLLAAMPLIALAALHYVNLTPLRHHVAVAAAAVIGLLTPDWFVSFRHKTYVKAVSAGLPDALDMLVICTESGLGLEAALGRVATEIRLAHPAIAAELSRTVGELRVASDSRTTLANLGARTSLDDLRRVAAILAQTMQYGTPLGQALRVLSAEMRQETITRFEARAARLPVLLTLPMILFILPCIFLIVGGPAYVQVTHVTQH